jgi:hypothetical protein
VKFEDTTLKQVWDDANCNDHPQAHIPKKLLAGVETILARQEVADWDNMAYAIGRLKDGRFIAIEEWEDSTGHGCRCGGTANLYASLEDALKLGLCVDARRDARKQLKAA